MGNTDGDSDGAAARLQHLQRYFREHPVTGPVEGRTTVVHPGAPLSLATLDHVTASVREIADHTYRVNPADGPVPAAAAAVYDWAHKHTEHADDIDRERLATVEYRQYLDHAIRAGDVKVIRRHPCPKCRTWGLMWLHEAQRAICTNTGCLDRDGCSNQFTLSRIATDHVGGRKNLRPVSAT
jgi:hypothetical protein